MSGADYFSKNKSNNNYGATPSLLSKSKMEDAIALIDDCKKESNILDEVNFICDSDSDSNESFAKIDIRKAQNKKIEITKPASEQSQKLDKISDQFISQFDEDYLGSDVGF